jgi:ElaB/YqjD/DUF883 family membrane-anchored ribosome-binding protein
MRWVYTIIAIALVIFCATRCASMPPTAKLIDQVTQNEDAIEEVEESELPEPVKARVTTAIKNTQKLAVQSSEAWEQCKADLAAANSSGWLKMAIGAVIGMVSGFFIARGFYKS